MNTPNLLEEELLPVAGLNRSLPSRPDRSTGFRWCFRGVRSHRLESVLIGGRRYTSREALQRFFDAISGIPTNASATASNELLARVSEAERELDEDGVRVSEAERELDEDGVR